MASRCNQDGVSALIQASEKGHTEIVRMLLDKDADDDMQDWMGHTALRVAERSGRDETAAVLIEHAAHKKKEF